MSKGLVEKEKKVVIEWGDSLSSNAIFLQWGLMCMLEGTMCMLEGMMFLLNLAPFAVTFMGTAMIVFCVESFIESGGALGIIHIGCWAIFVVHKIYLHFWISETKNI